MDMSYLNVWFSFGASWYNWKSMTTTLLPQLCHANVWQTFKKKKKIKIKCLLISLVLINTHEFLSCIQWLSQPLLIKLLIWMTKLRKKEEKWGKNGRNYIIEEWGKGRNVPLLSTQDWESGYPPASIFNYHKNDFMVIYLI